ncbi:MAG TPA: quercetin 2,3-dioxygenase [Chloroflexia bacterium]|nr:quercetin 2,3-dioxygenase [Chloroflexia bacterium]
MGDAATANMEPYMVAQGEGQAVWFLGTRMVVKATGDTTRGAFGLIEQELPPGFATPAHVHHGEDEPFYVLQGEITFHAGEKSLVAGPGSFVFLPRGVAHRFEVTGSGPARLLQFNLPAGLEQFFVDAGDSAVGDAPPPDLGRVLALAGKYQFEILGPPPSSD